jgi:ribosomal 50S subunit-recycling heat shock protein
MFIIKLMESKEMTEGLRIDIFLDKVRLIKPRSMAKTACDNSLVSVNGKSAKASHIIKQGDIIEIDSTFYYKRVQIVHLPAKNLKKQEASSLYEILEERQKE